MACSEGSGLSFAVNELWAAVLHPAIAARMPLAFAHRAVRSRLIDLSRQFAGHDWEGCVPADAFLRPRVEEIKQDQRKNNKEARPCTASSSHWTALVFRIVT
jgi:hypothetical protein